MNANGLARLYDAVWERIPLLADDQAMTNHVSPRAGKETR
jgi:hypothetical protein